jgi:hypothetical protein
LATRHSLGAAISKTSNFHIVYKKIGDSAFFNCASLSNIKIPNSVKSIGDGVFYHCTSLTSIEIPNGVKEIGYCAFKECTSLTSITIPNSIINIGDLAFDNCTSLASIIIPNSVTNIGDWAFSNCSNLTTLTIPNSVTEIGISAFRHCSNLSSITIPNSINRIGKSAFCHFAQVKPQYNANGSLRAFKAFKQDWTCRGFNYEIGNSYHQDGKIICYKNGFHACLNPLEVFNYYWGDLNDRRFAEVELSGEMESDENKVAASDIRIVRELTLQDLVKIYNSMEKE